MNDTKIKNNFLAVNKEYYGFGFKASSLLIIASIEELQRNNKPCYLTNEQFAYITGESISSTKRNLDVLEENNVIQRITHPATGKVGRTRQLKVNPLHQWIIPITYKTSIKVQGEPNTKSNKVQNEPNSDQLKGSKKSIFRSKFEDIKGQDEPIKDKEKNKIKNKYILSFSDMPSASHLEKEKDATPQDQTQSVSLNPFYLDFSFLDEDENI